MIKLLILEKHVVLLFCYGKQWNGLSVEIIEVAVFN